MKVTCKNVACKHYYELKEGEHCKGEPTCEGYTGNRKKAMKKIPLCKECEHCKRIYTNEMREYHYECTYEGRRKTILMIEKRRCDCRL